MKAGTVKSGSANIYYELHGDESKPIVALLHGNGQSIEVYRELIDRLKNDYYVLAVDSRGHGKSEFGRAQLSLGAMAIDLEAILEELNINKISIVGFGDGANIAMLFAVKCCDMADKLVLIGGNYNFSGYSLINRIFLRIGYLCSIVGAVFDGRNKINKEYFALIVKEPDLKKSSLRAIKADTLIISASKDIITSSHSKAMAKAVNKSKLVTVIGDRFWLFRNADKAYKIINEFLIENN